MKTISKITSVVILAAVAAAVTSISRGDDIVVKPLRHQPPPQSLFVEKAAAPRLACVGCKSDFAPTVTQDTKLKTKTVLVAKHGCNDCKTTVVRTGAQKATGKDVRQHTCGAMLAAAETCCAGMK